MRDPGRSGKYTFLHEAAIRPTDTIRRNDIMIYERHEASIFMKTDNTSSHISSLYDDQVRNTIPYYDAFHAETIRLVKAVNPRPRVWVDTGCGTGTLIGKAAAAFQDTSFILADPSPEMLAIAESKVSSFAERVTILPPCGSAEIGSEFYGRADVVTAIQAHHYLSRKGRKHATEKCHELLSADGIYITFENIRPRGSEGIRTGMAVWKQFQLSQGKPEESVNAHLDRFDREYFPITTDEHIALLKEAGFRQIEMFWYSVMQAGFYASK